MAYSLHLATGSGRAGSGDAPQAKLTTLYFGVSACRGCHDKKEAVPDAEALLYRGIEMRTWDEFDKHKDATRVLKGERSRQMEKLLGWNDVAADRRCLSCHGVVVAKEAQIDKKSFGPAQREESGVSCVVCHGAYEQWVNNHAKLVGGNWQELTRAEKERDHGLKDLWNPATRAALCCSCHVGNVAEGKVVTHEMYAAGHPPLPGIEVATFSDAMPRHWEHLSEKVRRTKNKEFYKRVHGFDADVDDNEHVRLLLVSSVESWRASIKLVHDLATSAANQADAWPELAVFDCYACHHDLKSESWRHLRGNQGRPGRPHLRAWPELLFQLPHVMKPIGASYVQHDEASFFLRKELDKTPFGEPGAVVKQTGVLLKHPEQLMQMLREMRVDRTASRKVIRGLLDVSDLIVDFDSARQAGWALQTLLPSVEPEKVMRPAVKKHLADLRVQLQLELPKGRVRIAEEYLPQVLKRIAAYDPREFQKTVQALRTELAGN